MADRPETIGELRRSGWTSRTVKAEIRANVVAKLMAGEALFPEVLGYDNTVFPQLENALLAGHDVIFLGERGQAKTRIIRSLTGLLDEWMPIVDGQRDQRRPVPPGVALRHRSRRRVRRRHRRSSWVHRDQRFGEKLATPDTSIADLIGEVDPIKVAEGRYLSDELTLHYGLVPRTNRGIFAVNELPDLAERIQVGLLNVLEERDIQVRGLPDPAAPRPAARRLGQPRGLHQPGPPDHPAEGPLRVADPHPLPARRRHRAGDHGPGVADGGSRQRRRAGGRCRGARVPRRGRGDGQPARPGQLARQPAQRRERAVVGDEPRGGGGQRRAPWAAVGRAQSRRPRRRPRRDGGQLGRQDRDRVARRLRPAAPSSTTSCAAPCSRSSRIGSRPSRRGRSSSGVRGGRHGRHRRGRVVGRARRPRGVGAGARRPVVAASPAATTRPPPGRRRWRSCSRAST